MTDTEPLTAERIRAMPAGRELDQLVWDRLMKPPPDPTRCARCGWSFKSGSCTPELCHYVGELPPVGPPSYSRSETHGLQLLDHLAATGWAYGIDSDKLYIGESGIRVRLFHRRDTTHIAYAPTRPLAVCRAALLTTLTPEQS
jgi:hypothetical protein